MKIIQAVKYFGMKSKGFVITNNGEFISRAKTRKEAEIFILHYNKLISSYNKNMPKIN